ncbi:MAG: transglycosylase SLT domain-containing protein [Deltaproteobacteria bacterium]|nr:transglycosylase SLT domain-containing protein [Deltaproteobacteria bacterium]
MRPGPWAGIWAVLLVGVLIASASQAQARKQRRHPAPPPTEARKPPAVSPAGGCSATTARRASPWPAPLEPNLEDARDHYFVGLCHHQAGREDQAQDAFRQGMAREPALAELWNLRLLESALILGEEEEALTLAASLAPTLNRPVRQKLRELLTGVALPPAGSTVRVYSPEFQLRLLTAYGEHAPLNGYDGPLMERLKTLAGQLGQASSARLAAVALWANPKDRLSAQTSWREIPSQGPGGSLAELPWLDRAQRLKVLGLHSQNVSEIPAAPLEALPEEMTRELGRIYISALMSSRAYSRAEAEVERSTILGRFRLPQADATGLMARGYLAHRRLPQAEAATHRLEKMAPGHPDLADLYAYFMRQSQDQEKYTTMARWSEALIAAFPEDPDVADAYWYQVWAKYKQEDFEGAAVVVEKAILATGQLGAENHSRLYYWQGRILKHLGKEAEAAQAWEQLRQKYPSTFYGLSAGDQTLTQRLTPPPASAWGDPPVPRIPSLSAVWQVPSLRRVLFLYSVGEEELADAEMDQVMGKVLPQSVLDEMFLVFEYLHKPFFQQRIVSAYYTGRLKGTVVSSAPLWRYAFPKAHWSLVTRYSRGTRLDPYFVMGIMREESHFRHQVDSVVGAQGLMQLMPDTGRWLGRQAGVRVTAVNLYEPAVNIRLGVFYLNRLMDDFDSRPVLVAAAYNGGPTSVRKWVRKFGHLPADEFIESIPFPETRRYVMKVYSSYIIYRKLYGGAQPGELTDPKGFQ